VGQSVIVASPTGAVIARGAINFHGKLAARRFPYIVQPAG
jgi:hypothetical protein